MEAASRYADRINALALIAGALAIPVNDMLVETALAKPAKAARMMTSWGHGPAAHKFDNTQPGHAFLGFGRRVMEMNDPAALHADLVACNSYVRGKDAAASISQPTLCLLAEKDKMFHSSNESRLNQGENLYYSFSSQNGEAKFIIEGMVHMP